MTCKYRFFFNKVFFKGFSSLSHARTERFNYVHLKCSGGNCKAMSKRLFGFLEYTDENMYSKYCKFCRYEKRFFKKYNALSFHYFIYFFVD